MNVSPVAHAKENAQLEQYLWVLITMKLMLMHVLTAVRVLLLARLKLSNRLKYYTA